MYSTGFILHYSKSSSLHNRGQLHDNLRILPANLNFDEFDKITDSDEKKTDEDGSVIALKNPDQTR